MARRLPPLLADQAGVEIGVDRHLLAGHRVEGEACRDLGDTARALGDHDEIDHDQNDEDDNADRIIAADQKVAKRFDHLACRVRSAMAFHQHDTGGSHIERQPQ